MDETSGGLPPVENEVQHQDLELLTPEQAGRALGELGLGLGQEVSVTRSASSGYTTDEDGRPARTVATFDAHGDIVQLPVEDHWHIDRVVRDPRTGALAAYIAKERGRDDEGRTVVDEKLIPQREWATYQQILGWGKGAASAQSTTEQPGEAAGPAVEHVIELGPPAPVEAIAAPAEMSSDGDVTPSQQSAQPAPETVVAEVSNDALPGMVDADLVALANKRALTYSNVEPVMIELGRRVLEAGPDSGLAHQIATGFADNMDLSQEFGRILVQMDRTAAREIMRREERFGTHPDDLPEARLGYQGRY